MIDETLPGRGKLLPSVFAKRSPMQKRLRVDLSLTLKGGGAVSSA
jgi:hypothetical protein